MDSSYGIEQSLVKRGNATSAKTEYCVEKRTVDKHHQSEAWKLRDVLTWRMRYTRYTLPRINNVHLIIYFEIPLDLIRSRGNSAYPISVRQRSPIIYIWCVIITIRER